MSENCSHNCSSCGETCASRTMESFRVPLNPQSSVKKVIGVVSGKGGVGKSLVTSLMACKMRARNNAKLEARMLANKNNPKKRSGMMEKLAALQKEQERMMREREERERGKRR